MENLIKIDEEKLSEIIREWFELNKDKLFLDKNFWERNSVGREMKSQLKKLGKWKYRARGNPKKGYQEFLKQKENW